MANIRIQNDLTPALFLELSFNRSVAHGVFEEKNEPPLFAAVMPDLYTIESAHSLIGLRLRSHFGKPLSWSVQPVQGLGMTKQQSEEDLVGRLVLAGMSGKLVDFDVQPSQTRQPTAMGLAYRSIHNRDAEHDHKDPRLANFVSVDFCPHRGFVRGSLKGNHTHLWIGG